MDPWPTPAPTPEGLTASGSAGFGHRPAFQAPVPLPWEKNVLAKVGALHSRREVRYAVSALSCPWRWDERLHEIREGTKSESPKHAPGRRALECDPASHRRAVATRGL